MGASTRPRHLRLTEEDGAKERPRAMPVAPALWVECAEQLPGLLRLLESLLQDGESRLPERLRRRHPPR